MGRTEGWADRDRVHRGCGEDGEGEPKELLAGFLKGRWSRGFTFKGGEGSGHKDEIGGQ